MDTSLTVASVGESLPLLRSLQRALPSPRLGRHWRGEGGGGEDREGEDGKDREEEDMEGGERDREERAWLRASPGELATAASFTLLFSSTSMISLFLPVFSFELLTRSCMSNGDMIGRGTF